MTDTLRDRLIHEVMARAHSAAEVVFGEYATKSDILRTFTTMLPSGHTVPMLVVKLRIRGKRKRWRLPFTMFPVGFEHVVVHVTRADKYPLFACQHCQTVVAGYTHQGGNTDEAIAAAAAELLARQIQCGHITVNTKS